MKTIHIPGEFPQDWIRNFTHIANLFFEETKISSSSEEAELQIELSFHEEDGQLVAEGKLEDLVAYFQEAAFEHVDDREMRKQQKRALAHVLLDVMEQKTGMHQSWGILTGIRPTKLYHRARMAGKTYEDIRKELQTSYRLSEEKISLMRTVADRQLATIPDLDSIGNEVSVYIGIPFCPTKCAYCTFPAFAIHRKNGRVDNFLDALHVEIREMGAWMKAHDITITSVYFGGGTPTSIEADEMDALYQTMWDSFPNPDKIREITVEAGRPDTITPDKLNVLKKWGIDRISVNPQSYTDETLKAIGRHHTVQETIDKFWLSREMGMNNINMDLIIGLPNEGLAEFEHSLAETEKMQPESLTVHTLSFKRASEMTRNKKKYEVADRPTAEAMMERAETWTEENGYVPYYLYRQKNILGNLENVGYSKPGEESIYNIVIMEEVQTIIGIGCGASSKFIDQQTGKITQYYNPKDPAAYVMTFEEATAKKIELLEEVYPTMNKIEQPI
ncbi:coproporphyrinogen III oxidase [Paenisporosarcina cavernae]|uniref:Coproporphyrinogen III oxidase n=1 Tax=Paenisporosarcina cavernae TaxID=2320858 RepID=A0A385YXA2_9BACL|nr:coproporphyrinogen III oxidase [Paenisporosarcina cavernae]AYC30183.1 coproporphyrinogen III oxidase [Paenisporosarcina cavernae]